MVAPGRHGDPALLPWPVPENLACELAHDAVPISARRGDIVLLHKRAPHASMPNTSARTRWSLDLRFHPSDQPNDRPWFPAIKVRSADSATTVRDADEWRRRWDHAVANVVASGGLVPGRPRVAKRLAEDLLRDWNNGIYPRADA
jgi:ectoine hydroxylase-related dioxygenase (phytanoyl-CoA dioxygenase family)